jgi:hypothetical protein
MSVVTPSLRRSCRVLLLTALVACQPVEKAKKDHAPPPAAGGSAALAASAEPSATTEPHKPTAKEARELLAKPVNQAEVDQVVNPKGLPPYSGPTGTVRGVVRVEGDPAVEEPEVLAKIAPDCKAGQAMFAKTPREGAGRTLGDALVAVTGYQGVVLQKEPARLVRGIGCAWDTRTIALTFGQVVRITAADNRPYVPDLMGQVMPAQLFALPGAEPVSLTPRKPGRFRLVDAMRIYSLADVFVLPYPTTDVTDIDGTFEITGIPVGKAKVSALLPASMAVSEKEVEISADQPTVVDFTLRFDAKAYQALKVELK